VETNVIFYKADPFEMEQNKAQRGYSQQERDVGAVSVMQPHLTNLYTHSRKKVNTYGNNLMKTRGGGFFQRSHPKGVSTAVPDLSSSPRPTDAKRDRAHQRS